MERRIIKELAVWKDDKNRKPMILKGARQTGKTWIMKEFGRSYFENYIYVNFDEEIEIRSVFASSCFLCSPIRNVRRAKR